MKFAAFCLCALAVVVPARANEVPPSQLQVWRVEEYVVALQFDKLDRDRAIAEKMESQLAQFPIAAAEKAEFTQRLAEVKAAHAELVTLGVLSADDSSFIYQGKRPSAEVLKARHRYGAAIVRLTDGNPWVKMVTSVHDDGAPSELVDPLQTFIRFNNFEWPRRNNRARADLFNAIAANGSAWNSRWFAESKLKERMVERRSVLKSDAFGDLRQFAARICETDCYRDASGVERCVMRCP